MKWLPLLLIPGLVLLAAPPEPAATPVTLSKADLPLKSLLAEVTKTGNLIEYRSRLSDLNPDPIITGLPTTATDFWPLMDLVARQGRLRFRPRAPEAGLPRSLEFTPLPSTVSVAPVPTSQAGPFRLTLNELVLAKNFADPRGSQAAFHFELLWEPRLEPLWFSVANLQWKDGTAAVPLSTVGTQKLRLHGMSSGKWVSYLPLGAERLREQNELSGELSIRLPTRRQELVVSPLVKGTTAEASGIRLTVEAVGPRSVRLLLKYPSGEYDLESHQGWAFADLPARYASSRAAIPAPKEVNVLDGKGITLVYEVSSTADGLALQVPAGVTTYRLPFRIANILLP